MEKVQPFITNFFFDNSVTKEQVLSLFDFGLYMIQWNINRTEEKKEEERNQVDKILLENFLLYKEKMTYFKKNSSIEEKDNGILLSFPIDSQDPKFSERNSENLRIWLRAYIDDYFTRHVLTGLSFKMMKISTETKEDPPFDIEYLHQAFQMTLSEAYQKKSTGFWIDRE